MELILTRQSGTQILVTCESQPSHTFDLLSLLPQEKGLPQPLDDPIAYGQAVYAALFPPETLARRALANTPDRILLVTTDNDLDAVPWEYAYGPEGFLVLECHFVRGLPADQRAALPILENGLHIVAVPSNPLSQAIEPLNIEGEWLRLKEIIQQVPYAITLERTRPPTIEQVRTLVANQRQRVIHFMGHGGQDERGAFLCFEQDNGELDPVTARQFVLRVRGTVYLITLNACVSATPGPTGFSNLAAALARQKIPYALGMRFSIPDDEARSFSRTFYSDLARGSSVEEALLQARLTLAKSARSWALGVPVLYTSLTQPAAGFASQAWSPLIREHQPPMEVSTLPRAEGTFQGRIDELKALGTALTGDSRPPLITIHGAGGQGKTALAREVVERFGHAWPGGVWATSLENLPSHELFVSDLARFLGIETQTEADPEEVERLVLARLAHRRTLIVLDNAETLIEAVEANNEEARRLAQFLREQVPRPPVSLLATSRSFLGWAGEVGYELTGLAPIEGVKLFKQHAPQRKGGIDQAVVWELSEKVEGHPLSLQLLGSAFNASILHLPAFFKEYEEELLQAENKYKDLDHRQRTLYASIETSVRYLDVDLVRLFSGLWLFHAPFLPKTAAAIFDPRPEEGRGERSAIYDRLHTLWQHSLLTLETVMLREGTVMFYHVLPTIRSYIEKYLARVIEREQLLARFGEAYAQEVRYLYGELDRGSVTAFIAFQSREDLERGASYVTGVEQGYYLLYWGWILQRLGDIRRGLKLIEQALEFGQGQDQRLELEALNDMALVYQATGQPRQAQELLERVLPIRREVGDQAGEAATLNNMALVYNATGQRQRALELYEQALPLMREVGDRAREATALNGMAAVYDATGQPQRALELYEQTLPLMREVGDRAGEATTLNNIALVYDATGQPQRALELYEQTLPLMREVGDRAGEATTLNNMAAVYRATGQPQRALELCEQALQLTREVGDRVGEATTLNNMAAVYQTTGQPQKAMELYEQALRLTREVGDRAEEATTLNNMALVYRATGQPQRALELNEQALTIRQEVGDRAGEANTLANMAEVLYRYLNRSQEAITKMEQAIAVLVETGLPQDAAGQTRDELQHYLDAMLQGISPGHAIGGPATMPAAEIQHIITKTVDVMTTMQEHRAEWRKIIKQVLMQAKRSNQQQDTDFFVAVLALLDGQPTALPNDHPYTPALAKIHERIAACGLEDDDTLQDDNLPFDAELIPRSIAALSGVPQEKMAHEQYLTTLSTETTDGRLIALLQVIQLGLFGSDLSKLGQNLSGVYREAWEAIVIGVETGGVDPHLFATIIQNTLAVLGPAADQRIEWRDELIQIKSQAVEEDERDLVALLDAFIGLLDAKGNPDGLGANLTGFYARTWQTLVEHIPSAQ
jgi:tetratricopeptide (TPR) repeat protein